MKKRGHYCKVCGEYKANEKFSTKSFPAKAMPRTSVKPAPLSRQKSRRKK